MKLSLCLDPGRSWADVLALAQRVDSAGWHSIYVCDHFMPHDEDGRAADGPMLECWSVLAAVADLVSRVTPEQQWGIDDALLTVLGLR